MDFTAGRPPTEKFLQQNIRLPSYLGIELAHVLGVVCLRLVFVSCKNSAAEVDATRIHKSIYTHIYVY